MKMKLVILSALILFAGNDTFAQKSRADRKVPAKNTIKFLNRTGKIIVKTQKEVKENKVYTGALIKARDKQREALTAFKNKQVRDAVKKSYIARRYAFMAYRHNAGEIPGKWKMNRDEIRLVHRSLPKPPKDKKLEDDISGSDKKKEKNKLPSDASEGMFVEKKSDGGKRNAR